MNQGWTGRLTLLASVCGHAVAFSASPLAAPRLPEKPEPQMVAFEVAEPEPPPPEPEVEPEPPPPEPEPIAPEPEPEPEPLPLESTPQAAETPPEPEPAPELTGNTLVSDGADGFEAQRGSGAERRGPVRAGVSHPTPKRTVQTSKPAPPKSAAPAVLPLAKLSKHPLPPALGDALERNYPPSARRQGLSGEAKVRARIDADGVIRVTNIASETTGGFGAACVKTLSGSKWSTPLDKEGKPVGTWISYRCKFRSDG